MDIVAIIAVLLQLGFGAGWYLLVKKEGGGYIKESSKALENWNIHRFDLGLDDDDFICL